MKQPTASLHDRQFRERSELNSSAVESGRLQTDIHPASLAFFGALKDSMSASSLPHPVQARLAGLVPAWQRWEAWLDGGSSPVGADKMMGNVRARYDTAVAMMEDSICFDRFHQQGRYGDPQPALATAPAVFATAALMFWHRPHALIEMTQALEHWLARSDIGDDIPADMIRPPLPCCYIRVGEALQSSIVPPVAYHGEVIQRLEGIYVFEAKRELNRSLAIVPIFELSDRPVLAAGTIELVINDEQESAASLIERVCASRPAATSAHHKSLAQVCAMVFFYLGMVQCERRDETPHAEALAQLARVGPKKAAKLQRQVGRLYDRILLGPQALPPAPGRVSHAVSAHWRRGHFRMQPHGPRMSLRKLMFIAPTVVHADQLDALGEP